MRGDKEKLDDLLEAARALVDFGEPEGFFPLIDGDDDDPTCIYCETGGHNLNCVWYRLKRAIEEDS